MTGARGLPFLMSFGEDRIDLGDSCVVGGERQGIVRGRVLRRSVLQGFPFLDRPQEGFAVFLGFVLADAGYRQQLRPRARLPVRHILERGVGEHDVCGNAVLRSELRAELPEMIEQIDRRFGGRLLRGFVGFLIKPGTRPAKAVPVSGLV